MKKKILALSISLLTFSSLDALALSAIESESDGGDSFYADASAMVDMRNLSVSSNGNLTLYTGDAYSYEVTSHARTDNNWHEDITPDPLADIDGDGDYDVWDWSRQGDNSQTKTQKNSDYTTNDTKASSYLSIAPNSYAEALSATPSTLPGPNDSQLPIISSSSYVDFKPGEDGDATAVARAWANSQIYKVIGSGEYTFSVPYFVNVDTNGSGGEGKEFAAAWAWAQLSVYDWVDDDWYQISGTYVDNYMLGENNGNLVISYAADLSSYTTSEPMYIMFEAGTDTIASMVVNPVPVPPSVLMLLTGCTSLFFMRRRKS